MDYMCIKIAAFYSMNDVDFMENKETEREGFLRSAVISYGELSLPSPHGEVLMYMWKWMLSLNL